MRQLVTLDDTNNDKEFIGVGSSRLSQWIEATRGGGRDSINVGSVSLLQHPKHCYKEISLPHMNHSDEGSGNHSDEDGMSFINRYKY